MTWSGREPSRRVPLPLWGGWGDRRAFWGAKRPSRSAPGPRWWIGAGSPRWATGMGPGRSRLLLQRGGAPAVPSGCFSPSPPPVVSLCRRPSVLGASPCFFLLPPCACVPACVVCVFFGAPKHWQGAATTTILPLLPPSFSFVPPALGGAPLCVCVCKDPF